MRKIILLTPLLALFSLFTFNAFGADITCSAGEYLPMGSEKCTACRPGYYCEGGEYLFSKTNDQGITQCDKNTPFSESGSDESSDCRAKIDCVMGTYLPGNGQTCETCLAGYYCDGGYSPYSFSANPQGLKQCEATKPFSNPGATLDSACYASITCAAGTFVNNFVCETCKDGYYCLGGTFNGDGEGLTQCPTTAPYSNPGAKGESDCYAKTIECEGGYYLPMGSEKCTICPSGSYCIGLKGAMVDTTKDQGIEKCPTTAPYSNQGAKSDKDCYAKTIECEGGYYLPMGSEKCTICPSGSYCIGLKGAMVDTTKDQGIEKCPSTTPESNQGAKSESDCYAKITDITCSAGEFLSKDNKCETCWANYYCKGGTWTPDDKEHGLDQCPTTAPYSDKGAKSESDCYAKTTYDITCSAGYYLPMGGDKCTICPSGSYCIGTKGVTVDNTKDQGIENCPNSYPTSDAGADSQYLCYKAGSDTCANLNGNSAPDYGTFTYANQSATYRQYYHPYWTAPKLLDNPTACRITNLSCTSPLTADIQAENPSAPLKNYWYGTSNASDRAIQTSNSYVRYRAINDNSSYNSGTDDFHNAPHTGLQLGEWERGWADGTKVHGVAYCGAPTHYSGDYACYCNINSYSIAGGSTVSFTDTYGDYVSWGNGDDLGYCQDNCAKYCAGVSLFDNTELFGSTYYSCRVDCNAGEYLPAKSTTCTQCPAGSYCTGGFLEPSEDYAVGIDSCSDRTGGDYPNSDAGATDSEQCYSTSGTDTCANLNPVEHGTAEYANVSASYRNYYKMGQQITPSNACDITSLTCDSGYADAPAGPFANVAYYANAENLSMSNTKIRNLDGTDALGNASSLSNGEAEIAWNNGAKIHVIASCNTTDVTSEVISAAAQAQIENDLEMYAFMWAENGVGTRPGNTFSQGTTGASCWFKIDGYTPAGGSAQSVANQRWLFVDTTDANEEEGLTATQVCAQECLRSPVEALTLSSLFKAELGELAQPRYCKYVPITCAAGTYLPANATDSAQCTTCTAGNYCPGGDFTQSASVQGLKACPTEMPNSPAGSTNAGACYTSVTCPAGQYLPMGQLTCAPCTNGNYCLGGTFNSSAVANQGLTACDSATPFSPAGSTSSAACSATIACPAGEYLSGGQLTCWTCKGGYYCDGKNSPYSYDDKNDQGIVKCPDDKPYSDKGAKGDGDCYAKTNDITCAAGEFLSKDNKCEACWENYYCKGGTWTPDDKEHGLDKCPEATPYSDKGAKGEGDCYAKTTDITCSAGEFLSKDNKCETCWENYYCKGGTWTPDDKEHGLEKCPDDKPYSDKGAKGEGDCYAKTTTIDCEGGYYLPMGDEKCSICPSGSYCSGIKGVTVDNTKDQGIEKCPTTAPYSTSGTSDEKACFDTPTCKNGDFLLLGTDKCVACRPGYYCKGGKYPFSETNDQGITQCDKNTPFSESGSDDSSDCKANLVCLAGTFLLSGGQTCSTCYAGSWCGGGTFTNNTSTQGMTKCDAATPFSPDGATSSTQCSATINCGAGEFLPKGGIQCKDCQEGYFCDGTKSPYSYDDKNDQGLTQCPATVPYSNPGAKGEDYCYGKAPDITCSAGEYLPKDKDEACAECLGGYYCKGGGFYKGQGKDQGLTQCPTTAPYSNPGAKGESDCYAKTTDITCSAGEFLSKDNKCETCWANYYCKGGTWTPDDKEHGLNQCPTTAPYSNSGAKSDKDCYAKTNNITCSAGEFLSKDNKCETCWANYYCKGGMWTPDDKEHGLTQCPDDKPYSDKGAKGEGDCYSKTTTIDCESGYYLPKGDEKCSICPSGSYCAGLKNVSIDNTKDQGIEKCPTTAPYSTSGTSDEKSCFDTTTCKNGEYLPAFSYSSCETCYAGYYCKGGKYPYSETNDQGIEQCDKSAPFSESGSDDSSDCKANLVCLAGTYLIKGMLTCSTCPAGSWCGGGTFTNNASTQGITKCDSATPFSPNGATSSAQCSATIDCAEGEFLKAGDTQCNPCQEGYFCSGAKGLSFNDKENQGLSECSKVDSNNPLSDLGAKSADDCYAAKCEAGEYLPEKSTKCQSCPKAQSCNGGNFKYSAKGSQGFTYSCDAGYYLPADSEDCALCPSDYYCPGVTDVEFDENNAQGLYSCPTSTPYSLPGTANSGECSATMYIICPAGQYLTKNATSCIGCPANYYCPGGIYPYNTSDDQGKIACNAKYPNSDAGSSFLQQCYITSESYSCSKINPVSNGTATYANSSSDAINYSNAGRETEDIGACEITSLTCDTGYVKEPSSNGPLANYVHQAHNISKGDTRYRALSGNSDVNSGAANGFGDSTGMTNGTAVIAWKDGTEIYLNANCNATAGSTAGEASKSAPSGSGNYCWCQMTGYDVGNGSTSVSDANLVYVPIRSPATCTDNCAEQCVAYFMSNTTVRTNIIGEYGEQMACIEPTYSCDPGYYLPANSTTCTLCEAGYYCAGFTDVPASNIPANKPYGRKSCPADHPSSDAGTTDVAFCYYDKTGVDCSTLVKILNTTSVSYANSPVTQRNYNGGGSVVIPFGGCAVTGATCSNAGEVLVGTDGPLANYEWPLYGMSSSTSNHNIYYRAIDGSSDTSSGNGNHGDSTGMTNGTFRLVYWNELDITGTASCAVNANGKYDCNCDLTSYKIGSGNTVSVNPAERLFSKTDFIDSLSSCEKKCAQTCAMQLAPVPEFGSLGMNKSCGVPGQTYTCAPGTYLPANATVCATCTQNHWCGGGTWEQVSFAQGLEDCPSEFPYSDAGSRDVAFCYKEPSTLQCSAVNPVRGANVTYANSTAATKKYNDGGIQTDTIGACAISSFTCNAGYTATNNWSDGPLVNYINASRNLDLSATKLKSNDGSTKSGTGELFGGDATSLNKGTFELVYSNGTKIQGRSSCNSTSGELFELKPNGTFNTSSAGEECWCNMTGYHLNGSSAVSVSDTNWVYWDAFGDQNSCATTCTKRCIQVLFQPENTNGEYENALFGAYGKNSVPPCNPNSYNITWYDGNNNLETNQCYYDEHLTIPSSATARTGYKIKWQIRSGN